MASDSMAAMGEMASMPDCMDCCPGQKQTPPDCQKSCPLAVLCMAKSIASVPVAAFTLADPTFADAITPRDDALRGRLAEPPPPRPPRA